MAILFTTVTHTFSLPPGLLSAICFVESGHTVQAMRHNDGGGATSVGACQIKLATARMLGFKGTENELKNPTVNIHYSGKFLRWQLNRYRGDTLKAVAAYNAGTYRTNDQGLIKNRKYVHKVLLAWEENK